MRHAPARRRQHTPEETAAIQAASDAYLPTPYADAPPRDLPVLGQHEPRRLDQYVLLFKALPGFARLFDTVVPAEHIIDGNLTCVCGAITKLADAQVVPCAGECGRAFVLAGGTVRRAQFPPGPWPTDADLDRERWQA